MALSLFLVLARLVLGISTAEQITFGQEKLCAGPHSISTELSVVALALYILRCNRAIMYLGDPALQLLSLMLSNWP